MPTQVRTLHPPPNYDRPLTCGNAARGRCHVSGNGLVDEMNLLVCPVVVGQGMRLFPETGPDLALDLVESRAFPKGITLQVYRPAGRPQYATKVT